MLTGTAFAALFLALYVIRAILFQTKRFAGHGIVRTVYLTILASHTLLAIAVAPLALITLFLAFRGDFARHRRIARVTLPIWLYVAATGWIIYWMLYHI
jgi:putative membrane protein